MTTLSDDLASHENARQIQFHLEADIDIRTVDSWTPPESETTFGNLIETRGPER